MLLPSLFLLTLSFSFSLQHAEANKLFCRFSNAEFHGATECLELDEKTLKFMKEKSNEMHLADP